MYLKKRCPSDWLPELSAKDTDTGGCIGTGDLTRKWKGVVGDEFTSYARRRGRNFEKGRRGGTLKENKANDVGKGSMTSIFESSS